MKKSVQVQKEIFSPEGYREIILADSTEPEDGIRYKVIDYINSFEEAIKRDEQFDGYYGIQTNEKNLRTKEVLDAYHNLWRIEESFRIIKSTLEV